jgi:hypothetical protein
MRAMPIPSLWTLIPVNPLTRFLLFISENRALSPWLHAWPGQKRDPVHIGPTLIQILAKNQQ